MEVNIAYNKSDLRAITRSFKAMNEALSENKTTEKVVKMKAKS